MIKQNVYLITQSKMKMSFITSLVLFLILNTTQFAFAHQNVQKSTYTFFLSGASFATPNNGWFELGSEMLRAISINRAKGGTAAADMANKMSKGALYSHQELEDMNALVIMHVVNRDVYNEEELLDNYSDYSLPFNRSNYAAAFDYVIKRYLHDCYQLKFNEDSKYYNMEEGKPAVIVLCTDWHDAREVYNSSVRKLAEKWGFPLVEFDRYIGFSNKVKHPVTGEYTSRMHSFDKQTINGEVYGWHPRRGKDQYIQQRMAAIFSSTMRKIFPIL